MSKYSEELKQTYGNSTKKIREATRDLIKNGKNLALEQWHDANSVERLKRCIREGK